MARPSARVVGDARGHQQAADIGVAEAERAVLVGELGDLLATGTAPSSPRFRARWSTAGRRARRRRCRSVPSALRNGSRLSEARLQAVSSRNMYSEHGFDARIGPAGRAGVPVVDGGVELHAGIGRGPGGIADLLPQVAGLQRLDDLAVLAGGQVPVAVVLDGAQEIVLDARPSCWSSGRRR